MPTSSVTFSRQGTQRGARSLVRWLTPLWALSCVAACDDAQVATRAAAPVPLPAPVDAATPPPLDAGPRDDASYDLVPRTFIENAPPAHTNQREIRLHFTASVAFSHFECALDAAPLTHCRLQMVFEDLPDGLHRVRAVATSPTGRRDPEGAEIAFVVDRVAPQTRIFTAPASVTGESMRTLEFGADETAEFDCALDGGPPRQCTSPWTLGPFEEGVHGVAITARDLAGNSDPTPATELWRIDRSPPETLLTAGPPALSRSPRATFNFESPDPDPTVFECALDAAGFSPCRSPEEVDGLGEGPHRFAVRALDPLGQVDATPATLDFEVRLTPPETEIRMAPAARIGTSQARFRFGPDDASFVCALDEAALSPCGSVLELESLAEGPHRLTVAAHDGAGHTDPTPEAAEFAVDLSPPDLVITGTPPALSNEDAVEFTFMATDAPPGGGGPVEFTCALDEAPPAPCDSPVRIDSAEGLSEGAHQFRITARDDVGHVTPEPAVVEFSIDRTAPQTLGAEGPRGPTTETSVSLQFVPEPGAVAECSLDGAPFSPCAPGELAADLADGPHHLALRQRDAAGNVEAPPVAFDWLVDTSPPVLVFTVTPPAESLEATAVFDFETQPAEAAQFWCRTDDAPDDSLCVPPVRVPNLAEGTHRFEVRGADALANVTPGPLVFEWNVDAQPPASPGAPTVWPGDGTLLVTWSIPAPPADTAGWRLLRTGPDDAGAIQIGEVAAEPAHGGFHPYIDSGRPNDVPFTYALQAFDRYGRGGAPGPGTTARATAAGTSALLEALPAGTVGGAALVDGRVLLVGGPDAPGATLFTPTTGDLTVRDPVAALAGSGLVQLSDGRLMAVGGAGAPVPDTEGNLLWPGQEDVQAFDPLGDAWIGLAPLTGGPRVSPTAVVLPRGQVAVVGGTTVLPPGTPLWRSDLYDADVDSWSLPFPAPLESLSPGLWVAVLASGDLLLLGDDGGLRGNPVTGRFDLVPAWLPAGAGRALLESGAVLGVGGLPPASERGTLFDPADGTATGTGPLSVPRVGAQVVLLPGGDALVVGGSTTGERGVERYDTERAVFVPAGALTLPHGQNTWAVLLPDGAVLVAGVSGVERYAPWYLDAGPRPSITDAPAFANRGQSFAATVTGALPVVRWVIVRLGAVSQGQNTDQRHLTLPFVDEGEGRHRLTVPADRSAAIPGPYLLFALDARGVPGDARVVLIQ